MPPPPKLTLRTAGLIIADNLRSLSGPSVFDMRPTSVHIIQRYWSGGKIGVGRQIDTVLRRLPPFIAVRHVSEREIASSGGLYEEGDVLIGPITPGYVDLNGFPQSFTQVQLVPKGQTGVDILYRLAQQAGRTGIVGDFHFIDFRRDRNLRFELVVGRMRSTPGP